MTCGTETEALKTVLLPVDDGTGKREQFLARVEREIDILSRATTPYLVKLGSEQPSIHSIGGQDYLIYSEEFLPGGSVEDVIKNHGPQSLDETVSLAKCLLEAIAEVEELVTSIGTSNLQIS